MQEVDRFIENLPADERVIAKKLRRIIIDTDPRVIERLSYGVPYFFRNRRLFFLWPASCLSPNKEHSRDHPKVTLGFCYGNLLSNEQGLLESKNRKQVSTISFNALKEMNEASLREIINEAFLVDEMFRNKRK